MNGVVPDERRRGLLARVAALMTLGAGADAGVLEALFDALDSDSDGDRADGRDGAEQTAVVDRIEDGRAVVLFEDAGYQRTVRTDVLPRAAREAGTVLRVPEGEALALATVDRTATEERSETAQERVDELAERPAEA